MSSVANKFYRIIDAYGIEQAAIEGQAWYPDSILEGAWAADFTNDILNNISIVPHNYTEEEL